MATASAVPAAPLERLRTYGSFVRFEHTLFSLPLILAGVFSAPGPALTATRWALIAIAAVGARTVAMALNRLIDRRLDALNPRTMGRELPAGRMRAAEAWLLLAVSAAVYLAACAALGPWFLKVAPIPLIVFTAYPYLKRFTPLCHFGVGAALALAPLAGYAAAHPDLAGIVPSLWLSAFALAWVSGFDIIYATLDEGLTAGTVRSMVTWFGRDRALRVSAPSMPAPSSASAHLGDPGQAPLPPTRCRRSAALAAAGILLYLEQKWAEDVNLAFFRSTSWSVRRRAHGWRRGPGRLTWRAT
jgi:4-hydroxybenzoate polyprenyltransferase